MKRKPILILFVLLALLLAACGVTAQTTAPTAEPTATQELVPTDAPQTSGDSVWDRVHAAGKIIIGTSADYPPFEYYDANYQIVGFDASLARELGARLNLQVELVDIAFESLPAALQVGQIDAAIAAISVTPERQAILDFTNVYYSGQDMVLAREGTGIDPIVASAQLAQYRVGVERASVYASWIQSTLVDPGLMPETHLLQYAKPADAVRDLKENRNDLVIMDKLAANEYIFDGGVVSVGQNLNTQLFAIALPKGAAVLQAELNATLTEMQNDGTIAWLVQEFLNIEVPAAPPPPVPTATPVPGPTATPEGCTDAMAFVRDVKVTDGTEMSAGEVFEKVWRVRNTGTCTWDSDYQLVFVRGDRMSGGPKVAIRGEVKPGETYDILVEHRAPDSAGKYAGIWEMENPKGTPFGERIWVKITVPGQPAPTVAPPTATPVIPVQPTLDTTPVITEFYASAENVMQGELVVVYWSFSGEGLSSAKVTRTNPDGTLTPLYGGADVDPQGQYEDILMNPGTYTYTLNVSSEFGGSAVQTVVVTVNAN